MKIQSKWSGLTRLRKAATRQVSASTRLIALALLVLPTVNSKISTAHAQSAQAIFSFPLGPANPKGNLTLGPDGNFYGTTIDGGSGGGGVIYRLNLFPIILTDPASQTVAAGNYASFSVTLFGTAPFSYQWLSNNIPIAAATNSTLTIPIVTTANDGGYSVIVTNDWGSITSSVANLDE